MTKLVAAQAIDMTQIGAQLQAFFAVGQFVADSTTATVAAYHNTNLNQSATATGDSLDYLFDLPSSGTVHTFELDSPAGTLAYKFSDFDLTFAQFLSNSLIVGADTLTGSSFNDVLKGAAGGDILTGGLGKDTLIGGTEQDFFNFDKTAESKKGAARDVIADFSDTTGEHDLIDLKGIDANKGAGHNQKFKYIGTHHFHHKAGELHIKFDAIHDTTIVQGDVNGDAKADFEIELTGHHVLNSHDFIL